MPFEIGQNVGAYRVIEQLGQGGMATVYKAYHASLDRYVAIKVLHQSFKNDENFYLRFQREAQVVAKIEHTNIVPVYDFSSHEGEPYIVMKFVNGTTLKHRMKNKPLSLEETLTVLPAVAEALHYAHERGVLHRDVKPSNVMLDENDTPFLADFGLARIVSSGESTMSQDVLIGTPNYISPEQAKGAKNLTRATDIYSLGIMLYEIVVGRVPYSADTPYAVVHDHIYKALPIPSDVNPTVPPKVEIVLLKALAKDPEDRFDTTVALSEAFARAVQEENMNELSATSVRIDKFATDELHMPVDSQATESDDKFRSAVKAAVEAELASRSSQTPPTPAIQGVAASYSTTPTPQTFADSRSLRRRRRQRRQFWVAFGFAILVFICIGSLVIVSNALNNPVVQENPALAANVDNGGPRSDALVGGPPEEMMQLGQFAEFSLDELEAAIEETPNDAALQFMYAMRLLERGRDDEAAEFYFAALNNPDASAELYATAALGISAQGYTQESYAIWFEAYKRDPENPIIRNDAGQFLYRQFEDLTLNEIAELLGYENSTQFLRSDASAFELTMAAHALISDERLEGLRVQQAERVLERAFELDSSFAETHLVYGNYLVKQDDIAEAIESWRFANSFEDAPAWVQSEAQGLIDIYAERLE